MTVPEMPAVPPDPGLPRSAWALGWTCLAAQMLSLADRGLDQSDFGWVTLSVVATAVVVGWISAGVLRARPVRLALVWLLFVVGAVFSLIGVIDPGATHGLAVLGLVAAVAQLVALAAFSRSRYFREQRAQPSAGQHPDISGLVLIAVVVGGLGGLTAPAVGPDLPHQVHVGL
jgi:hypothetical protein